jgi:CheY-like chemotaxis protein
MPGNDATILVVDDDEAIRVSLSEFLTEEGFGVKTANNGREAMNMLASGLRPCAIILDLMMPVMDGWDFRAEQLCSAAVADIPVALVSGFGFSAQSMRVQFPGIELLDKPVSLPHLLAFVQHCRGPFGPL